MNESARIHTVRSIPKNIPFAAFDIDGTIFRSGWFRELIAELIARNQAPTTVRQAYADYEPAWRARRSPDAHRNFEHAICGAFDKSLTQIGCGDYDKAVDTVFARMSDHVYRYTRDLVGNLKQEGYALIAISGSQEEFVAKFAEKYGFDIWSGHYYERSSDNKYFTGHIIEAHTRKSQLLQQIMRDYNLRFENSLAVGDTGTDIEMLALVERPIAFNPSRELVKAAQERGWQMVVERKNVIYELSHDGTTSVLV